ncbi:hypothetical protein [Vibrio sonorensis]|uniref:hypothetical protein n=1 Tax=Vibrio sonorensis TaxID=1004316 RepID=UPI003CCB92D8
MRCLGCLILFFIASVSISAHAESSITLTLPSQLDNGHRYYHEILKAALKAKGVKLNIQIPAEHTPQKRVQKMVQNGSLSLTWMISTPERDRKYNPIDIPLTNGLIGKRILLIPPELQTRFDAIRSLKQLQDSGLAAGLGLNWFDVNVWKSNHLKFYGVDGEWRAIYDMLTANGDLNYFPRGMTEVVQESRLNPHLAIEKNLLLVYEKDFKFYLGPSAVEHRELLENALRDARKSGLMDSIIKKYWQHTFNTIQPENRTVIRLKLPDNGH